MRGRNSALIERYFPGYRSPKRAYADTLRACAKPGTVWLDLGCGRHICADKDLNRTLPRQVQLAVGADVDPYLREHTSITNLVRCDISALPFKRGAFNLVTAAMVFEHLEDPTTTLGEIARVCRNGARLVIFTPNRFNYAMLIAAATPQFFHLLAKKVMHYFNRGVWRDFDEEMFPTRYRANSLGQLRRLTRAAGFSEERLESLSYAHSFGFIRPLYIASLLFERLVDRLRLNALKADLLGVFVREP